MILRLRELSKEYVRGGVRFPAVDRVSLEVEAGGYVSIVGRSGSGKSTLLNLVAGMLAPTSGEVEIDGRPLTGRSDRELSFLRNEAIGFIPQGLVALPALTVLENVLLPFCLYRRGGDGEGAARYLLDRFGIGRLADSYPRELSGGELRRALIARALINGPRIVIADEPTSDLDVETSGRIMDIFSELNGEGVTLLLVSHDLEALRCGKTAYTMESGRLRPGVRLTPPALARDRSPLADGGALEAEALSRRSQADPAGSDA